MRRIFEAVAAFLLLVLLSPLFLILSVWILIDSRGGVFYRSPRVGQFEREITLYKFRTMVPNEDPDGITVGEEDPRITRAGRFLRRYKLDELPQLWNVLKGDMSLVGPRPDVPGYNEYYKKYNPDHYRMKPGLTSPASIFFMHESEMYIRLEDPYKEYVEKTIPQKVALDRGLIHHTLIDDLRVIGQTLRGTLLSSSASHGGPNKENKKSGILCRIISVAILAFLLRMALPEARYVFYPLFLVLAGYFLFDARDRSRFGPIFRSLSFYLVLLAIMMAAALYRSPFIRPWTGIFNGLELAVLFLILFYYVGREDAIQRFRRIFSFQLFIFSGIIGLVGLMRGIWAWSTGTIPVSEGESIIAPGSDYNFYVLTILYGILIGLYSVFSDVRIRRARLFLYNGLLIVLAANILLVPSRRGIVVFGGILLFLLLLRIWVLFRRTPKLWGISRLDPFLLVIVGILMGGYLLLFATSPGIKKNILIRSGLYRLDVREHITGLYCRYGGMAGKDIDFRQAYHRLWNPREDHPGETRAGGERAAVRPMLTQSFFQNGKPLFTAKAETQVRSYNEKRGKEKGYVVIATSSPEGGIERPLYVDVGDTLEVSVWVQVLRWSKHLGVRMPGPDNRSLQTTLAPPSWEGDGRWHPLRLKVGYDVFGSLPLKIGGGGPDKVSVSCWYGIRVMNRKGQLKEGETGDIEQKNDPPVLSEDQRQRWMAMHPLNTESSKDRRLSGNPADSLAVAVPGFLQSLLVQEGHDRDDFAPPEGFDEKVNRDSRLARWRLARAIYQNYTPAQQMVGAGFSYLPVYGRVFYDNPRECDYPHNPLISAFLYSGWIGGISYLAYLLAALLLYIRYLKREGLFFVLFLVTGLFVSISGNSHFSVPAFAFFTQWPFFIATKSLIAQYR